jgi:fatty-acyl-CoA synthase
MGDKVHSFELGLGKNAANHVPLSPLSFIAWAAQTYPNRPSVVHGARRFTWAETFARCRRLASRLAACGVGLGDTVAVMLANTPPTVSSPRPSRRRSRWSRGNRSWSTLTIPSIRERGAASASRTTLAAGGEDFSWQLPADEWQAIALNYTSGTTGNPKGVVYHHRGAYLNALGNIMIWGMPHYAVYLWTLPMFHCNGWCFPWSMAANVGTNVCLRKVDPVAIFKLIKEEKVTHYCGAPIVHSTLINAPAELRAGITHNVSALVAGAAPPPPMIEGVERIGFDLTHAYGLTETYGPAAVCAKHVEWEAADRGRRAELDGRQGVRYPLQEGMAVMDPRTLQPVPWDGRTVGEILFRGNITMRGTCSIGTPR